MKLSKFQIVQIDVAHDRAVDLENEAQGAAQALSNLITKITGIDGFVDHLQGDGFGFTPASNNDTHIYIPDLIKLAEQGEDITEKLILNNLSL
ncbi:MAG: hypothetical protein A2X18_07585 [Bacteroidetes bacterium GWF2_40_14]|nr:MAG: hypothetical protein A2X18_07585 [Bacteroidetes bacterium GWF2_40_14]